jgi:predicted ABC-type ATPase
MGKWLKRERTMAKTIYVVGGTNGVGKSTIREELLGPSIPYINADFIAQQLKTQHASLMLAELDRQYGSEEIKRYISAGKSFAFENNLHEAKTFQWLAEMQKSGYCIELFYIGVDNLQITTSRIQERVRRGEHHVPPNEVFARYENGMKLMQYYFNMPDKILMIDNTYVRYTCLEAEKGQIVFQLTDAPAWVKLFVASLEKKIVPSARSLNSIDEVRDLYNNTKSQQRKEDI